jgi:hypothetical protein
MHKKYQSAVVDLHNIPQDHIKLIPELINNLTIENSHIIISFSEKQTDSAINLLNSINDRIPLLNQTDKSTSSILKTLAYSSTEILLIQNGNISPAISMYYRITPEQHEQKGPLSLYSVINHTTQINNGDYKYALVDFHGFVRYDITHLIKIINSRLSPNGRIILVMTPRQYNTFRSHTKVLIEKLSLMVTMINNNNFDYTFLRFINSRPDKNAKVLIVTSHNNLISAIVAHHSPHEVGFILNAKQKLNLPQLKGYDAKLYEILYRNEGAINKVLKINNEIEMLNIRKQIFPPHLVEVIKKNLPCEYGTLYGKLINNNLISDESYFKKVIAYLAITGQVYLKKSKDINKILITTVEKK